MVEEFDRLLGAFLPLLSPLPISLSSTARPRMHPDPRWATTRTIRGSTCRFWCIRQEAVPA